MNEKPIYTQKVPEKGNAKSRTVAFCLVALAIIVLLVIVNLLPYSGILSVAVFALGAYAIHALLNNTVFDITYTLYEDRLVFVRRYGRMSWENEVFPFDETEFYQDKIEHRGKTYSFHPDGELKAHLGI